MTDKKAALAALEKLRQAQAEGPGKEAAARAAFEVRRVFKKLSGEEILELVDSAAARAPTDPAPKAPADRHPPWRRRWLAMTSAAGLRSVAKHDAPEEVLEKLRSGFLRNFDRLTADEKVLVLYEFPAWLATEHNEEQIKSAGFRRAAEGSGTRCWNAVARALAGLLDATPGATTQQLEEAAVGAASAWYTERAHTDEAREYTLRSIREACDTSDIPPEYAPPVPPGPEEIAERIFECLLSTETHQRFWSRRLDASIKDKEIGIDREPQGPPDTGPARKWEGFVEEVSGIGVLLQYAGAARQAFERRDGAALREVWRGLAGSVVGLRGWQIYAALSMHEQYLATHTDHEKLDTEFLATALKPLLRGLDEAAEHGRAEAGREAGQDESDL